LQWDRLLNRDLCPCTIYDLWADGSCEWQWNSKFTKIQKLLNLFNLEFPREFIEWPVRSPKLTPLNFLWGSLKSKVYFNWAATIEQLKERVKNKIVAIPPDTLLEGLKMISVLPRRKYVVMSQFTLVVYFCWKTKIFKNSS
jgi:hypothetical protein